MTGATDTAGRVVVLDVVGLQPRHIESGAMPALRSLMPETAVTALEPPFPALTVPVQTTLGTGRSPRHHGDVASGEYDRTDHAVEFWGRSRGDRTRLWEAASDEAGLVTGALFFQHLKGSSADVAVTPSPIEDEDNTLIEMNCWTNPDGFYDALESELGHFPLHNYWGPAANERSSRWILAAAREAVDRFDPDVLWIYVPHLDYVGQRDGPDTAAFRDELRTVDDMFDGFISGLRSTDRWDETVVNLVSEYGFHEVDRPRFPNRILREAGLIETDEDGDIDPAASDAFAMVDHQIAHVYADERVIDDVRDALAGLDGVDEILDDSGKEGRTIDHPNAGDLVLIADPDAWFQYYWWDDRGNAPPYATDMDIHAKPGFDPCELFVGESGLVSLDPGQVAGSHGRVDDATRGCYGLGGPAATGLPASVDGPVSARSVAPTIADVLGVTDDLSMSFEKPSIFEMGDRERG